jgi:hypothetical protein
MPRPHLTPGKDPVPVVQEAGWEIPFYMLLNLMRGGEGWSFVCESLSLLCIDCTQEK